MNQPLIFSFKRTNIKLFFVTTLCLSLGISSVFSETIETLTKDINDSSDQLILDMSSAVELAKKYAEIEKANQTLAAEKAKLTAQVEEHGGTVKKHKAAEKELAAGQIGKKAQWEKTLSEIYQKLKIAIELGAGIALAAKGVEKVEKAITDGHDSAAKLIKEPIKSKFLNEIASFGEEVGEILHGKSKEEPTKAKKKKTKQTTAEAPF